MRTFLGRFEGKLDAKYRTVLPAKLKACLPDNDNTSIVISRGQERCLDIYSNTYWQTVYQKLIDLGNFNPDYKQIQRTVLMSTFPVELDAQGRFLIPKSLVDYAQLGENYTMIGIGERIEIWNPALLEDNIIKDDREYAARTKEVLDTKPKSAIYEFINLERN